MNIEPTYKVSSTIGGLMYETYLSRSQSGLNAYTIVWDSGWNVVDETRYAVYGGYHPVEIHVEELYRLRLKLSDDWLESYWHEHAEVLKEG